MVATSHVHNQLFSHLKQPCAPAEEHTVKVDPGQQQPAAQGTDQVKGWGEGCEVAAAAAVSGQQQQL